MKPSQKVLNQLTQAIVKLVHPKRIILFGSAARGDMGKHGPSAFFFFDINTKFV